MTPRRWAIEARAFLLMLWKIPKKRPYPPAQLTSHAEEDLFLPAPELTHWSEEVFIADGALLKNPDHAHLQMASIAFLWTNVANERQMLPVVGTAELTRPKPMQSKWERARHQFQLRGWFGDPIPDFLITLDARYGARCDNPTFCALVEHELYHCALKYITNRGIPIWGIRGHDVEEHVGVVARYGVGAAAGKTRELVEAARRKPLIARARIEGVCGTCMAKAA